MGEGRVGKKVFEGKGKNGESCILFKDFGLYLSLPIISSGDFVSML